MTNKYIVKKNYYIKDEFYSFLLYFDYFSTGINPPKYLNFTFAKKIINIILRLLVVISFHTKIYKLIYKTVLINDEALIIMRGLGLWANSVKLVKVNGSLKILKKTFNKKLYSKEKKFYDMYHANPSNIKLPKCKFLNDNTIEIEFLKYKSFQRLVNDGSVSFKMAINYYIEIKRELLILYKNKHALIHGDLDLTNIYKKGHDYYLIDYTECIRQSYTYDFYTILYAILYSYKYISIDEKSISNFKVKKINILELLSISMQELKKIEKLFINLRLKRFPAFYNK